MKETAHEMAVAARNSSRRLQALKYEERREILLAVADALEKNKKLIRLENDADIDDASEVGYEKSLISRLTLKPEKISSLVKSVHMLADMEEPIGHILKRIELVDDLVLEKILCPLGVLLVIFESQPDALVQCVCFIFIATIISMFVN
ncbi:delta-1-pyrroline-5-carboxylate synthase-like [Vicia villosa]|uniref:delta-1-pyrroline-5-carboxylate synthase-like n=1 Tax=Vicia villosa TaxID=3911 RepID=UPI00273BCB0D|nr:delta-1-pyrroline-5-carboxylate synthase-like [Vicia villosa]XP_058782314.1 delta-1-pyrroline-5-carboxylate synthase-like [Vicia villosa]XP_058782315.1 delta-1-pyrroline-5-carboxylate synthase-like [Vicia villosa]XP_058782316.1 delta-1-pyrroline-5-carboxylate synthase-like [Vicia villosa]XP_058782317.1 delta-1-pyrroline-5-carboxylate synthase-like [Vicia villosa]